MSIVELAADLKSLIVFILENYDERDMKELEDYRLEKKLKQARALLQESKKLIRVHSIKSVSNNHNHNHNHSTKEIVNVDVTKSDPVSSKTSGDNGR